MVSPGWRSPSLKNTEGPWLVSTCPSMIEGPGCPGVGEFLNHAALLRLGPGWGTARVPSLTLPSARTLVRTPIDGMERVTGCEGFCGRSGVAAPAVWVASAVGAGRSADFGWGVSR